MEAPKRRTVIYEGLSGTTAVLLAGGFGTRLRSVVSDRPKALAEVAGRPFLEYLFDQLRHGGIESAVISSGYLGEQIESRYGADFEGLKLSYSRETTPLGTGGALRLALDKARSSRVLVMNGDSYAAVHLEHLYALHRDSYMLLPDEGASMVLIRTGDTSRYGMVEFAGSTHRVQAFKEKQACSGPGWINAGIYLIPRALVEALPAGRQVSLEREVFPAWAAKGLLAAFPAGATTFIDIGTPESYREAHILFAGGARP